MKLFFHYCPFGFSNCYILGSQDSKNNEAILFDPGTMDDQILDCIESHNYDLKGVFITHDHINHVHGLRTLKRIYNVKIYAQSRVILDQSTIPVKDSDQIVIGPFKLEVISVPGHSSDSVVFKIDDLLFTGDTLTAGLVGQTASAYGETMLVNTLRSRILSLPGDYTILPGHGPPSTLSAERRFNAGIARYDMNRNRRPSFKIGK